MAFCHGSSKSVSKLMNALGLDGSMVQRVVIDISAGDVVRIYVQNLASEKQLDAMADAIDLADCKIVNCSQLIVEETNPQAVVIAHC